MKYALPFCYGFATRAKTPLDKLSFVAIFLFPLWFVCMAVGAPFLWLLPRFALAVTALYCLYEVGYLQNDVYTAAREEAPTIRLGAKDYALVCAIAPQLIFFKVSCAFLLLFVLCILGGVNFPIFIIAISLMLLAFFSHNLLRSRLNILTYAVLVGLKYLAVPLLFLPFYLIAESCSALILAFILPRSIEHSAKAKYGLSHSASFNADLFRVKYYAVLCAVSLPMWLNDARFGIFAMLALWFFGYRSIVYYVLQTTDLRNRYR